MKAVLISIRPQWVELIARGVKTVDVRKTRPNMSAPFKCYIYCTKGVKAYIVDNSFHTDYGFNANGKVIGEFVCNNITNVFSDSRFWLDEKITRQTLLTGNEIRNYAGGSKKLYGWHISSLQIYDRPKELSEFYREDAQSLIVPHTTRCNAEYPPALTREPYQIKRAPQSWCYVAELQDDESEAVK